MAYIQSFVAALLVISTSCTDALYCNDVAGSCLEELNKYYSLRGLSDIQKALSDKTAVTEMVSDVKKASDCVKKTLESATCNGVTVE